MTSRRKNKEDKMRALVAYLGTNGRAQLTEISRELNIPTSTVYDYMKEIKQQYKFTLERLI